MIQFATQLFIAKIIEQGAFARASFSYYEYITYKIIIVIHYILSSEYSSISFLPSARYFFAYSRMRGPNLLSISATCESLPSSLSFVTLYETHDVAYPKALVIAAATEPEMTPFTTQPPGRTFKRAFTKAFPPLLIKELIYDPIVVFPRVFSKELKS